MELSTLVAEMRHETDRGKIVGRLEDIADARVDVVAPQSDLYVWDAAEGYQATLLNDQPIIRRSGVTEAGIISADLTRTAFRNLADRLDVPLAYLDRLTRDKHKDLVVHNLNTLGERDKRSAFVRFLNVGDDWLLRSVASNGYRPIDNLDVMVAVAQGMNQADLDLGGAQIEADWTMDRFRMRVAVPQVELLLPELLGDYKMPFTLDQQRDVHGRARADEVPPVLWAGFEVSNSETGGGAVILAPRAVVVKCWNGLTHTAAAIRQVHAGERLDDGVIQWSDDTRRISMELLTSKIADATRLFCSVEYLQGFADRMAIAKGIEVASPVQVMEVVQNTLGFSEAETRSVLDCFIRSGDHTVLGIGQAVTAAAQLAETTDRQAEMEAHFWSIVDNAATYAGTTV